MEIAVADAAREWLSGLIAFAAAHRQRRPTRPAVDAAVAHAERAILGASLAGRLAELDAARSARRRLGGPAAEPVVVVTTSPVGIEAVTGLLATEPAFAAVAGDRLAPVTELEYRLWCIRNPDPDHALHLNVWSWLKTQVPQRRWLEFAALPLGDGETYWLHREGLAGAGPLDRRASHLWKWDGRHAALLKAFVVERGV